MLGEALDWCRFCGEEKSPDTPAHVLLECWALMKTRVGQLHTLSPRPEDVRDHDVIAALAAAARRMQRRLEEAGRGPPDGGDHHRQ